MIQVALALTFAVSLSIPYQPGIKEQIKSDFKQAGKGIAEVTRPPRMVVKKAGKQVGHAFKEGGKAVGKGVKDAAKTIADGTKDTVKRANTSHR